MSEKKKVGIITVLEGLGVHTANIRNIYEYRDRILVNNDEIDYQDALEKISNASVQEWNKKMEYVDSEELIRMKRELLKLVLDNGIDLDTSNVFSETLRISYDLFLNHIKNPIEINNFLRIVLNSSLTSYDSASGKYLPDQDKIKVLGELIELALNKGADINAFNYIDLEVLEHHHELLLNFPTGPLNIFNFLKHVLLASTTLYDSTSSTYLPDQDKIKVQGELLKIALDRGANIDDVDVYLGIEHLLSHYDLFLNHSVNRISLEKFVKILLSAKLVSHENGKYIVETKYIQERAALVEMAYKTASENKGLDLTAIDLADILVVEELFDRGTLDDQTILKIILRASGRYETKEGNSWYEIEFVAKQKKLLEELFKRSVSIKSFSYNELNIEYNHVSVLKILLEQGLDPRALLLHSFSSDDILEVLDLAVEQKVKITPFILVLSLLSENVKTEVFVTLLKNSGYGIDYVLIPEIVVDEFIDQGAKFKNYFDNLSQYVEIISAIRPLFVEGGTLLHVLVKSDKRELVKYVLENYSYNINALNDQGQTPLFFAQSPEVAKALIEHESDLSIKDKRGNNWISNPSLELIEYAVENEYLDANYAERVAHSHFTKGNYEHAAKLYKIGFKVNVDPREQVVNSIINGLLNSIEKNKYQALLNLIHKAGIELPREFNYLLRSVRDDHSPEEFGFLNGLIHKLAQHYLNLAKAYLAKDLGSYEGLDYVFETFDFSGLKLRYPDSKVLARINDEFSAYYQIAGRALNILDNDFALEVLTINGLRPDPLQADLVVFRGMKVNLSADDIDSYFKFGHRGFSAGEYQKTLGFNVNQPWNEIGGRWEYGGTYSSVEAILASHFADGITSSIDAESVLLEIRIPSGAPKICGSWKNEYEIVPSTISGEDIVAIYTLEIYRDTDGKHYQVSEVHRNPYIDSAIKPKFKTYEHIKEDPIAIKNYNSLGCVNLPTLIRINKSGLYKDYDDFIERYTSEDFIKDQDKLMQDYFEARELYREDFSYGLRGECDLRIECCLYPGEL